MGTPYELSFSILQWKQDSNCWWGGKNWWKEEATYFLKTKKWSVGHSDRLVSRIDKLLSHESIRNVSSALCSTWNCYQHFPCEKTTLLKQEFWGLSFKECKVYGMDIPKRLQTWSNVIQRKFQVRMWFLLHGNKGLHKLWTLSKQAKSNV